MMKNNRIISLINDNIVENQRPMFANIKKKTDRIANGYFLRKNKPIKQKFI